MRAIRLDTAGPHTTVQDLAGLVIRHSVCLKAASDRDAMRLDNALVGNAADAAVLEVCLGGMGLTLAPVRVALTGTCETYLTVQDDTGMALQVPANRSVDLVAGQKIVLACLLIKIRQRWRFRRADDATTLWFTGDITSAGIGGVDGGLLRDGAQLPLGDVARY